MGAFGAQGKIHSVGKRIVQMSFHIGEQSSGGIALEDSVNMIVNGFCKEVFRELPMEFAVEAQKLLGVSLEGSVG